MFHPVPLKAQRLLMSGLHPKTELDEEDEALKEQCKHPVDTSYHTNKKLYYRPPARLPPPPPPRRATRGAATRAPPEAP